MRLLIIASLLLTMAQPVSAIINYVPGDTLYVWAFSGLSLREQPDLNSSRLAVLPYGTVLVAQNYSQDKQTSVTAVPSYKDGETMYPAVVFHGDFAMVSYNGVTGYLFDGYLSKSPPLKYSIHSGNSRPEFEPVVDWATRNFGLLKESKNGTFVHGYTYYTTQIFGNGMVQDMRAEKSGWTRLILPDFSMEEAFLLLNFETQFQWRTETSKDDSPMHLNIENLKSIKLGSSGCSYHLLYLKEQETVIVTTSCSC